MKKIIGYTIIFFIIITAAFFIINTYIYNEKQSDTADIYPEKPEEQIPTPSEPVVLSLQRTWQWVSALYNDGRTITPKKDVFRITFGTDGRFSAVTDCNRMSGPYVVEGDRITIGPITMTKMYCEGSQESIFGQLLENTTLYRITDTGELLFDLKFDSGTVSFRSVP